MNIIIHRYNSICEPDYIDAFKALGINVIEDREEMTRKSISMDERVKSLGEMILVEKPLFVFTINFFPYIAMVCEKLQCLYVCVSVDCPVVELFSNAIKSSYNRVFLFDYNQYIEVRDFNPNCIFHLSLGVNVNRIVETIGEPDWTSYKYDVSFVGSLYNEKNPLVKLMPKLEERNQGYAQGLIAAQSLFDGLELIQNGITDKLVEDMKKADRNFYPSDMSVVNIDKFVATNNYFGYHLTYLDRVSILNRLAQTVGIDFFTRSDTSVLNGVVCHGGVSSLVEMPKVFRESKINLNLTMRSIKTGLPQRIWDVMGCGGFLLTNYQAEIPEYLEIGKHLAAYENISEAEELITYFLCHEEERIEIAKSGFEEVRRAHTVLNRVAEMIRIVMDTLG